MRRLLKVAEGLLGLLALGALAVILALILGGARRGAQPKVEFFSPLPTPTPRQATPTPRLTVTPPAVPTRPWPSPPASRVPTYTGTPPTATPRPGEIRTPAPPFFTPTPLPIARTVDLAPGVPDEQKDVYIIQRSDGTYEKYFLQRAMRTVEEVRQLMNMGPQDVIVTAFPLKPLPKGTPPRPTYPLPTSTQGP